MLKPKDQIYARMYVVLTLLSILPVLVVVQVLSIHVNNGTDLRLQGERQAHSFQEIPALRGSILDNSGRTLAANSARYVLSLDPTMPDFREKSSTIYGDLSRLTGRSESYFRNKVKNRASRQYVTLLSNVTEWQGEVIESWELDAFILEPRFSRTYNHGHMLAHVLGHVSKDNHGIAGLELQYNEYLDGTPGKFATKLDRLGDEQAIAGGRIVRPKQGEDIVLTIDLVQQSILEEELAQGAVEAGARWATAIAMDPHTGAILAMANVPTYDPNRAAAFETSSRRNHAVADRIEPGSTFKLVSAVTALEQRAVSLSDSIETGKGYAVIGGAPISDTHANGTITFEEAIALSSNVAFGEVSKSLDKGKFYQYARNFGFGQPTWIDLPGEVGGRLKKPNEWSRTTPSRLSIGYEVEVTPLQLLAAYSALANEGLLVQPYIVAERRDYQGRTLWKAKQDSVRRAFKASTARKLLSAFENVVNEGTAKETKIPGIRIAGKTGTANKVVNGRYDQSRSRASFVGFFPADDPKVAMVIVMDEPKKSPYGGVVAAPVFKRVAQRWVNTMPEMYRLASGLNVASEVDSDTTESSSTQIPQVIGQPVPIALAHLEAAGIQSTRIRQAKQSWIVEDLEPEGNNTAGQTKLVKLSVAEPGDKPATMPNLTGLSVRQATNWLLANEIKVTVHGHGSIESQSVKEGNSLPDAVVLRATR